MVSKTSLLPLVRAHDWRAVEAGLTEKPALIHHRDAQGRTWLHWAAGEEAKNPGDSIRTVDVLIAKGLGFDDPTPNSEGFHSSPLWHAIAFARNNALAEHLLKMGAKAHGLFAAAWNDDAEAVDLLVRHGAPLDPFEEGHTPFIAAVGWERWNAARALVRHGADVNARDAKGRTALHYLLGKGADLEAIKQAIALGCSLEVPGPDGRSARQIMAKKKDPKFRALAGA